ncbi:SPOSA6832_05133 [Sporobolomyces salmonicolor]|uniref:Golgi apparatus membrane protein TVP38 n=1 Tax=Sporidiobolus salmonicolor TaxID=5005 RepID=A0A0D6ETR2_SPOSA|nr:SPOSA6832_05133 [Sporobolomyces salmonicolor]
MGFASSARNEWSEAKEAAKEIWEFVRRNNWKQSAKKSFARKYWAWWITCIILIVALVFVAIYRDQIVAKFEPHKAAITNLPASWVIPIAILILLSFPPLGGHEIVLLVVGLIWGVWVGFGIACAGTFFGEMMCFFVFKYWFTKKAAEVENKSVFYACVARLQREGGIGIIIIVRFSAIPGHVVTAIQSTSGMSWWKYSVAVIISLPKQLAVVWLGDLFGQTSSTTDPSAQTKHRAVSLTVFFVTALASVVALYLVYMRARRFYPQIMQEADLRRTSSKDTYDDAAGDSLAAAAMNGEGEGADYRDPSSHPYGGYYVGGGDGGKNGPAPRIQMVRTNTSGTWTGAVAPGKPQPSEGPFSDPTGSTSTVALGNSPPRGRWSEIEDRERRQALTAPGQVPGGYGYRYDASQESLSHLPLASESEVGRQQGEEGQGRGREGHEGGAITYVPSRGEAERYWPGA